MQTPKHKVEIYAGHAANNYWRDFISFRELFFFLCWRDVLVRYKQTAFGILWAAIRPFATMLAFTVVFGRLASLPTDGDTPYPILVFAGLLPWQLFASAVQQSSESLVGNTQLISKIYFPRLMIPISAVMSALLDAVVSLVILFGLMLFYRFSPDWRILFLPAFMALGLFSALGIGLLFGALNVSFRDFRYIIPFMIQFGLYVSPVGFSSSVVPEQWRLVYSLNPMVGVIDGYRWCLLGGNGSLYIPSLLISVLITIVMLVAGLLVFRKMEATFADKI